MKSSAIDQRQIPRLLALAILMLPRQSWGDGTATVQPRPTQLGIAYGFGLGHDASLRLVERDAPHLALRARLARAAFYATALGEGLRGAEQEMRDLLKSEWPKYKENIEADFRALRMDETKLTPEAAIDVLKEIEGRAKGQIPDDLRMILLSANPRFREAPEVELAEGWVQTFRTAGHAKAKGVDFSITMPASWSAREGARPNMIRVFRSGAGHGLAGCTLAVREIPVDALEELSNPKGQKMFFSEQGIRVFGEEALRSMTTERAVFISGTPMMLDGQSAGMVVGDVPLQSLDVKATARMTMFVTIIGKSFVLVQFVAPVSPDGAGKLEELHARFLPLYRAIVNTLVLHDRYR